MLDIAALKSVVDLFKNLLKINDALKKNKRKAFKRTCAPLYEQLQPIAKQYYDMLSAASVRLNAKTPNLASIIHDLESQRSTLVIARNGILGATAAFEYYRQENESDEPLPEVKRSELEELTYRFAESVWDYFYHEEGMVERPTVSGSSCLIDDMCEIKNSPLKSKEKARLLDELRETSKNILAALERNWAKVSERYMRLKLYCDS